MPERPNARLVRRQRIILARMGSLTPPPPVAPATKAELPAALVVPNESRAEERPPAEPPALPVTPPVQPPDPRADAPASQDLPPR